MVSIVAVEHAVVTRSLASFGSRSKHNSVSRKAFSSVPKAQATDTGTENAVTQPSAKPNFDLKSQAGPSRYSISSGQQFEVATAGAQAFLRFGSAAYVSPNVANFRKRPDKPLELYEFEGCPFCRKVREAVTILDLDVLFYPCPSNGPTWRPKAVELSGKRQFPFLVDPNNGRSMLESDDIITYLWEEYGDGKANIPFQFNLGPLTTLTAGIALAPRSGRGSKYRKSRLPEKPISLWAYEASPFCKLVREVLNELEIPHLYISVARNSPKRPDFIAKWDVFQVPYIEDPNTGSALFETSAIIEYLEKTYAV